MAEIITATFQDGAFVPEQAVSVPAGARVKLTVEPVDESAVDSAEGASVALDELCERLPIHSGLRLTRDQLHERD